MKRLILAMFMAITFCLTACADGRPITFDQLPANAQMVITQNFVKESILFITMDSELFGTEYEVKFNDGKELDFDGKGNIIKIDYKYERIPDALLPAEVVTQVQAHYPNAFIIEWKRDDGQWKAELSNDLELVFNKKYQLVGIDD